MAPATKRRKPMAAEPTAASGSRIRKSAAAAPAPAPAPKRQRVARVPKKPKLPPHQVEPGALFTWGNSDMGQLGRGADVTDWAYRPVQITEGLDGQRVVQLGCGNMHHLVLAENGAVYSWGVNDEGALGRATAETPLWHDKIAASATEPDSAAPGRVDFPAVPLARGCGAAAVARITQVAAGGGFSLAIDEHGRVWGWGTFKEENGSCMMFSQGVSIQRTPAVVWEPDTVRDQVVEIAAGSRHAVALTRRGEVLTWGLGGNGQLGRLPPPPAAMEVDSGAEPVASAEPPPPEWENLLRPSPVNVVPQLLQHGEVTAHVAASDYCTFVVTSHGRVIGCGLNNVGQLCIPVGDDTREVWEPQVLEGVDDVAAVAGGLKHTLFLQRSGDVVSAGQPLYGALGRLVGDAATAAQVPQVEDINRAPDQDKAGPVARRAETEQNPNVLGLPPRPQPQNGEAHPSQQQQQPQLHPYRMVSVAAENQLSGCVTEDGEAYFWGSNVNGQLAKGESASDDDFLPRRFRRTAAFGARKVHAIGFGSLIGVMIAGEQAPPQQ